MDNTKVKEILGKQLELLAEVSEGKPGNLAELSAAMCEIADRIVEVRVGLSTAKLPPFEAILSKPKGCDKKNAAD